MATNRKVVIITGAGATRSDFVDYCDEHKCPPLDKGFFSEAMEAGGYPEIFAIEKYMKDNYAVDIFEDGDRLEHVMGAIYSDALMPVKKRRENPVENVFLSLFSIFGRRIADTTNGVDLADGGYYGRMLAGYLREAQKPGDITAVTFNQDLQMEKAAYALHKNAAAARQGAVFNFPYCYKFPPMLKITSPKPLGKIPIFPKGKPAAGGISILKPHGSLNWFSTHPSDNPPLRESLLDTEREISVTRRAHISTFTYKTSHTLPIVVPPVGHKAGILHKAFAEIWQSARDALQEADEIVVFGYSCPEMDRESENLIRGSLLKNDKLKRISVIDPSSATIKRYADLTENIRQKCLHVYRDADSFLGARFPE